jgi:hypothetical protein
LGRVTVVALIALVVGGVCGVAVGSSGNSTSSNSSASKQSPSASPTASSQQALVAAYVAVVTSNSTKDADAFTTLSSECGSGDMSRCRAAAVTAQAANQKFLSDLGRLTVPACLAPINQEVDAALVMYSDGDADVIAGIDGNDTAMITAGADLFTEGTTHLTKATNLMSSKPCG